MGVLLGAASAHWGTRQSALIITAAQTEREHIPDCQRTQRSKRRAVCGAGRLCQRRRIVAQFLQIGQRAPGPREHAGPGRRIGDAARQCRQAAQPPYRRVVGHFSGKDQAQGNEGLVGRPGAHGFERPIEGQCTLGRDAVAQDDRNRLALGRPAVEKIAVDGMEWHPMGCASQRRAVPVAALMLLAASGAATAPNPAAAIAAAAGHPARLHLQGRTIETRDGEPQTTTLDVAGNTRLERQCHADLCAGTWFDGHRAWTFGLNGTALPQPEADAASERTFAAIASTAFAEPDFVARGGLVRSLPTGPDGRLRFAVTAPQGSELVAIADAKSARLTAVERPDHTAYRPLVAVSSGTALLYADRPYRQVDIVAGVPDPPAGPALTLAGKSEIPLLTPTLPIVPCSLQGLAGRCLIDTGTTPSAVTLGVAERLNQEPHGRLEIAGPAAYLTGVVDAGPLTVGSATVARLRLAVIPRARGADFDIILGADVLAGLWIELDTARGRARIGPSSSEHDAAPIAVGFNDDLPYVDVRLGTRDATEPMLLDTGDMQTLSIGYDAYREDTGLFAVNGASVATRLGGAPTDTLDGTLDRAEIGGVAVSGVAISAVRGQHGGHLGYGFIRRCAPFVLDLAQQRIECRSESPHRAPGAGER